MTNKEVINFMGQIRDILLADKSWLESTREQINEAFDLTISALEKQIPKKPICINKNKEFDGNWKKICPSCGSMLTERITTPEESFPRYYNYTQHCWCGQAIDWTEGEG